MRPTVTLRQRGGVWAMRYRAGGKRVEEGLGRDERAARAAAAAKRRELASGVVAPKARTVAEYLDERTERRRAAGVRSVEMEVGYFTDWVKPAIGKLELAEVTRVHLRDLMAHVQITPSPHTGKVLAPRTVLHVYRAIATAFADAVLDGLLVASPATLKTRKGELPRKRDARPTWRAEAVYTADEIEALLFDERLPLDRRAFYALQVLAGLRSSEACGRRWRDLDTSAAPLGRLTVATQADGNSGERATKTEEIRVVPVVPLLAEILVEWRRGFALLFGREPEPGDPIVPSRADMSGRLFRLRESSFNRLVEDLERLELRRVPSAQHSLRASFLTLLESVGANMAIARRATHSAPADVVGGYIRTGWADLCREVGKLPVRRPTAAEVLSLAEERRARAGDQRGILAGVPRKPAETLASRMGPPGVEPGHAPL